MTDSRLSRPMPRHLLDRLIRLETPPPGRAPALIGLSGRLVFSSLLLGYFWASARTKIDMGGLSLNAYAQIFPRQFEQAGYDVSALGPVAHLIVAAGTLAEFMLPLFILLGLFTRLSSIGMIGFVVVMTLTDIYGHGIGPETLGALFDRHPDGVVFDQRLVWVWLLAVLVTTGGGYASLDRILARVRRRAGGLSGH
ncbi:DoxX family protein [Pseudodonghicola xiamenensis]|uniref:Oxidoreductase n=1 Tax=Pseudodonghicola xiamenensis TaxID=337702 RepID=A0A8J3H4U2_9RHOB|nr:DoxX family protein [Pseudodonghicola xiamenensis]GHG79576.1 hypothetical protein GCM10010961_01760 [Pseudodonghicola xiamenensis]